MKKGLPFQKWSSNFRNTTLECRLQDFRPPPRDFCTQLCGLRDVAMDSDRSYSPARYDPHEVALSKGILEVYCRKSGHRLTRRNDSFPGGCRDSCSGSDCIPCTSPCSVRPDY